MAKAFNVDDPKEARKFWAAALRDWPEERRCEGRIAWRDDEGNEYRDVFGVAIAVYQEHEDRGYWVPISMSFSDGLGPNTPAANYPPKGVVRWLGLRDREGSGFHPTKTLADLNDEGVPFTELADLIESVD